MRIRTRDDVVTALDGAIGSAALGAAMELGLFWLLGSGPLSVDALAADLDIPASRCLAWLRVLERDGMLTCDGATGAYGMTPAARGAIVGTYTPATWALLAEEARERREGLGDLPARLRDREPRRNDPDYISRMAGDPSRGTKPIGTVDDGYLRKLTLGYGINDLGVYVEGQNPGGEWNAVRFVRYTLVAPPPDMRPAPSAPPSSTPAPAPSASPTDSGYDCSNPPAGSKTSIAHVKWSLHCQAIGP